MSDEPTTIDDQFVFLEDTDQPFLVRRWEGSQHWLYFWSDERKEFTSSRSLFIHEVEALRPLALPAEEADLYLNYHELVRKERSA